MGFSTVVNVSLVDMGGCVVWVVAGSIGGETCAVVVTVSPMAVSDRRDVSCACGLGATVAVVSMTEAFPVDDGTSA